MTENSLRQVFESILSPADIRINGTRPWDIRINDEGFYQRVLRGGTLALGESYMDGWWDCEDLIEFFHRIIPTNAEKKLKRSWRLLLFIFASVLLNPGRRSKAFQIGERHYDIGNDLYKCMLDKRMVYSCAYWKNAGDLDSAQEDKLDLICRKLGVRRGDRILDIGCGWGSFARFAAEKYGACVVGLTVSKEQVELGKRLCKGLPVEMRLQDYRDVADSVDHVVSVGMFEHVGYKNYRTFMEVANRCLKNKGLLLLQTIGQTESKHTGELWVNKYIFPNSMIPSMKQISDAAEGLFTMEDMHNFGPYYENTLRCWYDNFEKNWEKLKHSYDKRFHRMWRYYLLSFAGAFRARYLDVWQIVFSKGGVPGGYVSIR